MGQIGEIIRTIASLVPTWVLVVVGVVLAVAAVPGWLLGLKIKKVKALLRRVTRAEGTDRARLLDDVWELADGKAEVLLALAREADKVNQPALRDRAVKALQMMGGHDEALRKLEPKKSLAENRKIQHPLEAAAIIRTMLENGADEAARGRLNEALERFPSDADLMALRDDLEHPSS